MCLCVIISLSSLFLARYFFSQRAYDNFRIILTITTTCLLSIHDIIGFFTDKEWILKVFYEKSLSIKKEQKHYNQINSLRFTAIVFLFVIL